ncbi:hypothetical protein H696_02113 [Fonticula alba]|uniref:THH1/TOM1/TOM3 domain-containing protein n=1 Tax=Fonticula alba TaxID=691883 RepID=A0A058ZCJ8_FONAL|nr:hypothetical protein H696_02113 [Fonticula alba]KCV71162.1 hypothetical protein H696_02113 [Fonticula alba]|eukprot:XP_009494285.1 hypothetical protein H696_02113 [Fonticula alba]
MAHSAAVVSTAGWSARLLGSALAPGVALITAMVTSLPGPTSRLGLSFALASASSSASGSLEDTNPLTCLDLGPTWMQATCITLDFVVLLLYLTIAILCIKALTLGWDYRDSAGVRLIRQLLSLEPRNTVEVSHSPIGEGSITNSSINGDGTDLLGEDEEHDVCSPLLATSGDIYGSAHRSLSTTTTTTTTTTTATDSPGDLATQPHAHAHAQPSGPGLRESTLSVPGSMDFTMSSSPHLVPLRMGEPPEPGPFYASVDETSPRLHDEMFGYGPYRHSLAVHHYHRYSAAGLPASFSAGGSGTPHSAGGPGTPRVGAPMAGPSDKRQWQKFFHLSLLLGCILRMVYFALKPFLSVSLPFYLITDMATSVLFFSAYNVLLYYWAEMYHSTYERTIRLRPYYIGYMGALCLVLLTLFLVNWLAYNPYCLGGNSLDGSGSEPCNPSLTPIDIGIQLISIIQYAVISLGFFVYGILLYQKFRKLSQTTTSNRSNTKAMNTLLIVSILYPTFFLARVILLVVVVFKSYTLVWWFNAVYFTLLEVLPIYILSLVFSYSRISTGTGGTPGVMSSSLSGSTTPFASLTTVTPHTASRARSGTALGGHQKSSSTGTATTTGAGLGDDPAQAGGSAYRLNDPDPFASLLVEPPPPAGGSIDQPATLSHHHHHHHHHQPHHLSQHHSHPLPGHLMGPSAFSAVPSAAVSRTSSFRGGAPPTIVGTSANPGPRSRLPTLLSAADLKPKHNYLGDLPVANEAGGSSAGPTPAGPTPQVRSPMDPTGRAGPGSDSGSNPGGESTSAPDLGAPSARPAATAGTSTAGSGSSSSSNSSSSSSSNTSTATGPGARPDLIIPSQTAIIAALQSVALPASPTSAAHLLDSGFLSHMHHHHASLAGPAPGSSAMGGTGAGAGPYALAGAAAFSHSDDLASSFFDTTLLTRSASAASAAAAAAASSRAAARARAASRAAQQPPDLPPEEPPAPGAPSA